MQSIKIGYPKYVAILGVIAVVCAIITFFSTKEVNAPKNEAQSANIFREFKKYAANRWLWY